MESPDIVLALISKMEFPDSVLALIDEFSRVRRVRWRPFLKKKRVYEFPDIVLALIHEFSRPRVNKEALNEFSKVVRRVRNTGTWGASLKKKMVKPEAVEVVREFNRVSDLIQCLQIERNEFRSLQSMREINRLLLNLSYEREAVARNMYILAVGEAAVLKFEKGFCSIPCSILSRRFVVC